METGIEQTLDDLDETALWLRLNAAKARLAVEMNIEERIALRNEIGDLTQRIRRAQHKAAKTGASVECHQ